MAIEAPAAVRQMFFVLTGMVFPEGNEDLMRVAAGGVREAGTRVGTELSPEVEELTRNVLAGLDSQVSPEYVRTMSAFSGSGGVFAAIQAGLWSLSDATDETADSFVAMKVYSIVLVSGLLAQMAVEALLAFFDIEVMVVLAARLAIVRFLLRTAAGKLFLQVAQAAAVGVGIQELFDGVKQAVLIAKGIQQAWNWQEDLEVGLLGAGLGLAIGPAERALVEKLEGTVGRIPAEIVVEAAGGGIHNAGHETLFTAMKTGQWQWNWGTFAGGASQAGAHLAGHALAGTAHAWLSMPEPGPAAARPADAGQSAVIQQLDAFLTAGGPTPSGHVFLAHGAPGVADDTRDAVDAAFSFPPVIGATVLHLHTTDRGIRLAVGDQLLTPAEFFRQKVPLLNLVPGQPVIIVGCNAFAAAPELARLLRAPVVAANMDVYTLRDRRVITAQMGISLGLAGSPSARKGNWMLVREGQPPVALGADLLAAIRSGALSRHLGTDLAIGQDHAPFLGAPRPVRWSGGERISHEGQQHLPNHAQYRMLAARHLRLRPGQPDFWQALIEQTATDPAAGPTYLTSVLRSQGVTDPVTPRLLRRFLTDQFVAGYTTDAAGPQRFDPYLFHDDGNRMNLDEAVAQMRDEGTFGTMMGAVMPRLAADHLGLNVAILTQSGFFEELSPAAYGDHPVFFMTTGSAGQPLVALVPGGPVPPDDTVPSAPLRSVIPDIRPAGPPSAPGLAALTEAASTLGAARAVANAVNRVRAEASQAQDATVSALIVDPAALAQQELEKYLDLMVKARGLVETLDTVDVQRAAADAAAAADTRVRGAAAALPPWLFGPQEAEQQRNWQAVDAAAEVTWSQTLIRAADRGLAAFADGPEPESPALTARLLSRWTREERETAARQAGRLAYLRVIHEAASSVQTMDTALRAGKDAARRMEAVPPEYGREAPALGAGELNEIQAAGNAARTLPPAQRNGIHDDDEAAAFFARAAEHRIRQRLAEQARQRRPRSLPTPVTAQLDRFESAETARRQAAADAAAAGKGAAARVPPVRLGPGQEQHQMSFGEWGQLARVGGQWLDDGARIADQAASGFLDGPAATAVRAAVSGLFKEHGSRRASRMLASGLTTPLPGRGPARYARLRVVLGSLRGPGGPSYVPAHDVEQAMQLGARPYNPTDPTHSNLGGTYSGFSNARSATLPFTEPSHALPLQVLGLLSAGPSLVVGGGRGFGRYEGSNASSERQLVHGSGLAYFEVPASAGDARTGSHWEITLLNARGEVIPLLPGSKSRQLLAAGDWSVADFTDGANLEAQPVVHGSHVRPADVLLSFPLDEAQPAGQTAPRPLGEEPPDAPAAGHAPIRLPDGATDEEAEEFHAALWEVFAPVQGIAAPTGLAPEIAEELSEHNLYNRQYAWLTSGMLSPEWDPAGDGKSWARMKTTGRLTAVQRVGGNRDVYVQQDARHLQWAEGRSKTISGNATAYYDTTLKIPSGMLKKLAVTLFPWAGVTADNSRTETGVLGSGDWRYKGYTTDVVTYAADVKFTADVQSSVPSARGRRSRAGTMYINVPVAEVPRFEARLRRAAAQASHPGSQRARAGARDRAATPVPDVAADGPAVTDRELPASIRAGRSRGPGIIDLLPGAQHIIPAVMRVLRGAQDSKYWHQREITQRMTERDWMHVEAALGRLISAEALIPLSSLLLGRGVPVTLLRQVPGAVERTTINVKWVQDRPGADGSWGDGTPPVISRVPNLRIDHYPVGYTAVSMKDALTSGFYAGWAPTLAYAAPLDTDGSGLASYGAGGGYSMSRSRTVASTAGTGAWASHGWVYEGPVLQAMLSGRFEVSIAVDDVSDPLSAGSGPEMAWLAGKYALKRAWALIKRGEQPEWSRVIPRYRGPGPLVIRGKQRSIFPESLAPPAGTPERPVRVMRGEPEVIGKRTRRTRRLVKKVRPGPPADPRFTGEKRGELGPEDLVAGVPGLAHVRQAIADLATMAGISPDQSGDVLDKHFNEDQVVGRMQYGGTEPLVAFSMFRPGFITDRLADVTVRFSFYDLDPTGQKVLLSKTDMADAEPNLGYAKSRTHAHGFSILLGKLKSQPLGDRSGPVMDGGLGMTGNLRTKTGSVSRDVTWLDGHWNVHPLRQFAEHDFRVVADVQLHVWRENAAGRLAPVLFRQQVSLEHGIDFYRASPRPRLLPPPGVPQRLPAAHVPLLSNLDQLEWVEAVKSGLNPLQQQIIRVISELDSSAVTDRWEILTADGGSEARLVPSGLSASVLGLSDDVAALALMPQAEGPHGVTIQQTESRIGRSTRLQLVVTVEDDPHQAGYRYSDTADDAVMGNYQVSIDKRTRSTGRTKNPVPGLRGELGIVGEVGDDPAVPSLSAGPDEWNKDYAETWTRTRNALRAQHLWLRDVLTVRGAHYYQGRVRFVVRAYQATSPSLPVNLLAGGLPRDTEFALRGPTDLSRPVAAGHADAIVRRMMPKNSVPPADKPLPPAPDWKHVGPAQDPEAATVLGGHGLPAPPQDLDIDAILADQGLKKLPLSEDDLRQGSALVVGLRSRPLAGAYEHALMTLTGGIFSGHGRITRPSRLIGRLLTFGGGGPAWLGTIFSPVTLKRYSPRMVGRAGYTFPRLVADIGRLTGAGDATVKLAFYNAKPGPWHEAALAHENVDQDENQTGSGSGKALTESGDVNPTVSALAGNLTFTALPSAVLNQHAAFGSTGGAKTVRVDGPPSGTPTTRRQVNYQEISPTGVLMVLEVRASKYAGRIKLPGSLGENVPVAWGRPVAEYLFGGKARLVYRLDNSAALLLDPVTSVRLRMLPAEGIRLPASRVFPLTSDSPERDADRVKAASSLARHGRWDQLFLSYDPVTDRVRMTVTEEPAGGGPAVPVERELDVEQFAALIKSKGHPMVLVGEGGARLGAGDADSFGTRLGRLLSQDVIATPDKVLQDGGRTLAARFEVDALGAPVAGTIRRGNWMLLPADGSGPLLLGDDLDRVLAAEVPARLRAPAAPHIVGAARPRRPVAWTAPAPAPGAVPAVPPGPARLDRLPAEGRPADLGAGMVATARPRADGGYSVLVHSRGGNPADWAHVPPALPHRPGYLTVAVPEPYRKQDGITRALDTLIGGGAVPPGQGVLLLMSGAAGTGPGSLAHRLQQRYQNPGGAGPATGHTIIAPGGMLARIGAADDVKADVLTYHEDDDPAQWWRFSPNSDPVPLSRWLSRSTDLAPAGPVPLRRPVKAGVSGFPGLGSDLQARPIPAGYHLTANAPLTEERFLELESIPLVRGRMRLVIDAEHYGDGTPLAEFLDWLDRHPDPAGPAREWARVVELQSADPAGLARSRRAQGLAELSAGFLRAEEIRLRIPVVARGELAAGATVTRPAGRMDMFLIPPLRPHTRLEAVTADTLTVAGGVPNGVSQREEGGYPIVWQVDDRRQAQWRPYAQYLSHRPWEGEQPHRSPVVTGVLPSSLWLRDGSRLREDPDRPGAGVFGTVPGGPVIEVIASGLWIRPDRHDRPDSAAADIRATPPSARGPLITIGLPGQRVSEAEWELAHHLVAHLLPPSGSQRQRSSAVRKFLRIAGNVEPATTARVSRLADTADVTWLGTNIVAGQYSGADAGPRVTQDGPLPAHHVPGQPARPAAMGTPHSIGPHPRDHGIPHGPVTLPARPPRTRVPGAGRTPTFDLGAEVVVNPWRIDRAYVIVRRGALGGGTTASRRDTLRSGQQRLTLPPDGFFRALVGKNQPSERLRPGDALLRVWIPPGAAILPSATRNRARPAQEGEVWIPPRALPQVQVSRAYAADGVAWRSTVLRRNLAALMAVPAGETIAAGWLFHSPGHIAAEAVYQRAGTDFADAQASFPASRASATGLIAAHTSFAAAKATRDRAAAGDQVAHHIRPQPGETILVFSADPGTGLPALDGRPATSAEFARAVTLLVARHPGLNQRVFRLAGAVSREYVKQLADSTGYAFVAADSPVYLAAAGVLDGTLVATTIRAGQNAPAMPPTGRWWLFLPRAAPRELSLIPPKSAGDRDDPKPPNPQAGPAVTAGPGDGP